MSIVEEIEARMTKYTDMCSEYSGLYMLTHDAFCRPQRFEGDEAMWARMAEIEAWMAKHPRREPPTYGTIRRPR